MDWKQRTSALLLLGLMINAVSAIFLQTHVPVRECPECNRGGTTRTAGGTCGLHPGPEFRCPTCRRGWHLEDAGRRPIALRMLGIRSESWWERPGYFPWSHPDWSWSFRRQG